jgi:hypothetical protein
MDWKRVVQFVVVCFVLSFVMEKLYDTPSVGFATMIVFSIGYVLGSFQMVKLYKNQIADAIKELNK